MDTVHKDATHLHPGADGHADSRPYMLHWLAHIHQPTAVLANKRHPTNSLQR
jgi:hypothetical protein